MSGNMENKSESGESVDLKYDCKRKMAYTDYRRREKIMVERIFSCAQRDSKEPKITENGDIYFQLTVNNN